MARLNAYTVADSEDELPDLGSLLLGDVVAVPTGNSQQPVLRKVQRLPRKGAASTSRKRPDRQDDNNAKDALQPANRNITCLPAPVDTPKLLWPSSSRDKAGHQPSTLRSSPRRKAKANVDYTRLCRDEVSDSASCIEEDDSFTDLSGFIVSDSESVAGEELDDRWKERGKKSGGRCRGKGQGGKRSRREEENLISDFRSLQVDDRESSNALPQRGHDAEPLEWSDSTEPDDQPAVIR